MGIIVLYKPKDETCDEATKRMGCRHQNTSVVTQPTEVSPLVHPQYTNRYLVIIVNRYIVICWLLNSRQTVGKKHACIKSM